MCVFCQLRLSEFDRGVLLFLLCIFSFLALLLSFGICCAGYLYMQELDSLNILHPKEESGYYMPKILFLVGTSGILFHGLGAYHFIFWIDWMNRPRLQICYVLYKIGIIAMMASMVAIGIATLVFYYTAYKVYETAFINAFKRYKLNLEAKVAVDVIQLRYECCGAKYPTDWFELSWVDNKYIDQEYAIRRGQMRGGQYFSEVVPYSCCSFNLDPPCRHDAEQERFDDFAKPIPKMNKIGCIEALNIPIESLLFPLALSLASTTFAVEVIILGLFRLFQTSAEQAADWADPSQDAHGYFCWVLANPKLPPNAPTNVEETKVIEDDVKKRRLFLK